ncbi:hypothetical protein AGLY_014882 [Aphis glycines]|uniref:Uncharacterized protein n=1 Tax=Aphis glycines TaxID=307491 RepID=A0A6G0T2U9_APHGL|nr:hypothetical protein AGLY_014882 [Aphis glycines]
MFLNQYAMTKMKKYEKVYGPYKCVQTVVAKENREQPIYYNYDTPKDKEYGYYIVKNYRRTMLNFFFPMESILGKIYNHELLNSNTGLLKDIVRSACNSTNALDFKILSKIKKVLNDSNEVVRDCELLPDSFSLVIHDNELTFGTAIEFEAANEPFDDLEIECINILDQNKTSKSNWISHIAKDNLKNYPEKS